MDEFKQIIKTYYDSILNSGFDINCGHPTEFIDVLNYIDYFDWLYQSFGDEQSKSDFLWLMKFKMAYSLLNLSDARLFAPPPISVEAMLDFEQKVLAYEKPIILDDLRDAVECVLQRTYIIDGLFEPVNDDVIIDGGAFTGNSALVFSEYLNDDGEVHAFEAAEVTYRKLEENVTTLNLNNVSCHKYALTDERKEVIFSGDTVSARIDEKGEVIQGISIDDFVEEMNLQKIGLIKLDVEGAELDVIRGAKETIARYKPKLAISAYHKKDDLYVLTKAILEINDQYRIYFRAKTKDLSNLILFFTPSEESVPSILSNGLGISNNREIPEYEYFDRIIEFQWKKKMALLQRSNKLKDEKDKILEENKQLIEEQAKLSKENEKLSMEVTSLTADFNSLQQRHTNLYEKVTNIKKSKEQVVQKNRNLAERYRRYRDEKGKEIDVLKSELLLLEEENKRLQEQTLSEYLRSFIKRKQK